MITPSELFTGQTERGLYRDDAGNLCACRVTNMRREQNVFRKKGGGYKPGWVADYVAPSGVQVTAAIVAVTRRELLESVTAEQARLEAKAKGE